MPFHQVPVDLGPRPDKDPATDLISPPLGKEVKLVADPGPTSHEDLPKGHGHRLVALVENPPGMLMMYELAETTVGQAGQFTPLAEGGLIGFIEHEAALGETEDRSEARSARPRRMPRPAQAAVATGSSRQRHA